jgi:hypothetical protein
MTIHKMRIEVSQDTRAMATGGMHRLPAGTRKLEASREVERIEARYASAKRPRTRVWRIGD